jgi:Kef-type K+ transport system membrane component KefB/nucleotide-binding universal stress UspA family protein
LPFTSPAWVFLTLMLLVLVMPLLAERVGLPGVIGLVIGGLIVGPEALGLLERSGTVAQLGGLGILYLMFLAGLELDLDIVRKNRRPSIVFGVLTFLVPITIGTVAGLAVGYAVAVAILIGSLWASHTLVAYPIVRSQGLASEESVAAAVGATIITDTLALLVLAVVVGGYRSGDPAAVVGGRIGLGLLLLVAVAFGLLPRVARWFFRGLGQDGVLRFVFVLCALLSMSALAQLVGTEPIVGAFFAGLALNPLVPNGGFLMQRIEFFGSALFIPFFLISVGMLVDLSVVTDPRTLWLAVVVTAATIVGKYGAAWLAGRVSGFDRHQVAVMFSLSVAQAAATLAASIVAFEAGLFDDTIVNAALIVILLTVVLAGWVAKRFAPRVTPPDDRRGERLGRLVVVPVANPEAAPRLVELAIWLARADGGEVIPLHVVTSSESEAVARGREMQARTDQIVAAQGAEVAGVVRVDASVARGVINTVLERDASLTLVGWTTVSTTRSVVLGSLMQELVRSTPAPLAVAYLPGLDVFGVTVVSLPGASPVDIGVAGDLADRIGRGARLPVRTEADPSDAPAGDLLVVAAPGGDAFARTLEDLIKDRPERPLVAVRAFAEVRRARTTVSELFGD